MAAADGRAPWPDELADVARRLDAQFRQRSLFLPTLGGGVADWGPGWAVVQITPPAEAAGLSGTVSNAVLAAVADTALEFASNSYGRECLAIGLTASYHEPVSPGVPLVAVAGLAGRNERTVSYDIEIRAVDVPAAEDRNVATFTGRVYRTGRWHLGEEAYPQWWRDRH